MDKFRWVRPVGRVELNVYENGQLIEHDVGPNLVVDNAKFIIASLLMGDEGGLAKISQIAFGSNSLPPEPGNMDATLPAFYKDVDNISFGSVDPVTLLIDFSLGSTEGNFVSISEFCLMTQGYGLFARRVRPTPLVKTSSISFSGTWTIEF